MGRCDEYCTALEEQAVKALAEDLVAVLFHDLEFEACTDPWQRRISELVGWVGGVGGELFLEIVFLEVLGDGQIFECATTDRAEETIRCGAFERTGADLRISSDDEFACIIELGIHRGLHFGGRRDEAFPLNAFDIVADDKAIGVDTANAEGLLVTGHDDGLGRNDLECDGLASLRRLNLRCGVHLDAFVRNSESVEMLGGRHIECAVTHARCAEAVAFEFDLLHDLAGLLAGFHHDELAFHDRAVKQAIHVDRGGVQIRVAELQLPDVSTSVGIDRIKLCTVGELINHITDKHGRTARCADRIAPDFDARLQGGGFRCDRNGLSRRGSSWGRRWDQFFRQLDADHAALLGVIDVFITMDGDEVALVQHHGGVHAVFADGHLPVWFAVVCVHTDDVAATGGEVGDAFAIAGFEHGCREGAVHGRADAGQRPPGEFAGFFVEAIRTVGSWAVSAPVGEDEVDDDELALDHRAAHA